MCARFFFKGFFGSPLNGEVVNDLYAARFFDTFGEKKEVEKKRKKKENMALVVKMGGKKKPNKGVIQVQF